VLRNSQQQTIKESVDDHLIDLMFFDSQIA
jgi:hypothetical protein